MDTKASIVITTYNRAKLLEERSLRSALNQTLKDYEIIVVDDAGTDTTGEIREKYQEVGYFKLPENRGLSYARNFGIKQAKGKYIVCLDDDNELLPKFLEKTIDYISNFDLDAVGVGRIIQYKDFAHKVIPKLNKFTSIDWGWLIKKDVFDDIQYDENMRANEDTDFGIRFNKKYLRGILAQPLCVAYDTDDPKSSLSYPNNRELQGMTYFFDKNLHEYDDPRELWHLYKLMGRKFYRGGYRLEGLIFFWQGLKAYPNLRSFSHLFFALFGWFIYNIFMTIEERIGAKMRNGKN